MSQPEPGAGEGLLVTRILLYLPRYKKAQLELRSLRSQGFFDQRMNKS